MKTVLWLGCVVLAGVWPGAGAEPNLERSGLESKPVDYMIVVTGGELLAGTYADSHTPFLTRTLHLLGCRCVGSMIVDDDRHDLQEALRFATNRAVLVIVTGGLGPTPNDITRETLAEFTDIPLREDPAVLAGMERRLGQSREQLRPNLRRQALVPGRGTYLKNATGTAVGLVFDSGSAVVVALPGPPRELQPMVTDELVRYLRQRFGVRAFGCSLTLRFVGVGQSLVDQTLKDHVAVPEELRVTSLFEDGRVDFTFSLPGNTAADQARLRHLEAEIREHLGPYIYASDSSSLEAVVMRQMQGRGGSLALAEIGSAGHLTTRLSAVEGMAGFLVGSFAAPSEEAMGQLLKISWQEAGSDGAERAKAVAAAAAGCTRSTWVIAVGPMESEARGGRYVWVALQSPGGGCETQRMNVRGSGETAQAGLTTVILDWLRRQLK